MLPPHNRPLNELAAGQTQGAGLTFCLALAPDLDLGGRVSIGVPSRFHDWRADQSNPLAIDLGSKEGDHRST